MRKLIKKIANMGAKAYIYPIYIYYKKIGGTKNLNDFCVYLNNKEFDECLLRA